jgi:GT2 family glycosyltransferase
VAGDLRFSIIIPTRERPAELLRCLEGIAELEYPRSRFETIVVHDGLLRPRETATPGELAIRVLGQTASGPAAARNEGARGARGEYLVFLDDDCVPDPGWLAAFDRRLEREPHAALGGRTENALADNPYAEATQLLVDYLYSAQSGANDTFFTSNNLVFPASPFRALGGFDPSFPVAGGEDRDLCSRWLARGNALWFEPDALVRHEHALTLRTYLRQHFNYGRGAFAYRRRQRRDGAAPRLGRPAAFYVSLIRYPFSARRRSSPALLSVLLALSQPATALGYLWAARGARGVTDRSTSRSP